MAVLPHHIGVAPVPATLNEPLMDTIETVEGDTVAFPAGWATRLAQESLQRGHYYQA